LSFKFILVERKVEAIYRVVRGEKIQPTAREAGVEEFYIPLERKGLIRCKGNS